MLLLRYTKNGYSQYVFFASILFQIAPIDSAIKITGIHAQYPIFVWVPDSIPARVQDISSTGHQFELAKSRTNVRSNQGPPAFFLQFSKAYIEALDPQIWQTTHWKPYCKSISQTFYTILNTWPLLEFFFHLN